MMEAQTSRRIDLDIVLGELGALGRYQVLHFTLLATTVLFTSSAYFGYIFTTSQLGYRCKIPVCDGKTNDSLEYSTEWLHFAVPFRDDGKPESCQRYQYLNNADLFGDIRDLKCNENAFNQSVIENCNEFVFAEGETNIINEFNITCEDNEWKLALIGSLGYLAELIVLPLCAFMSDKYGRRPILVATLLLGGICGLTKSFSINYQMYATMEFLTAFVSTGTYMTVFILAIETAEASKRVFGGTLISLMFSTSQAVTGLTAMLLPNFRSMLQVLYAPSLLVLTFIWMVPESARWLITNGKMETARAIIMRAVKMNRTTLSNDALEYLDGFNKETVPSASNLDSSIKERQPFLSILRSRILGIRLTVNLIIWFLIQLVYYGMIIQSVSLAGNKYANYIVVSAVEIPAILVSSFLMVWVGRKWSLFGSLILNSLACVVTEYVPKEAGPASLLVYVAGKFCVTIAFSIVYVYSAELFPTSLRHCVMNACLTIGTLGSILAPFITLLGSTWNTFPLLIFGASALLSGLLVLILPETINTRLPDTIAEAEQLTKFQKQPTNPTD